MTSFIFSTLFAAVSAYPFCNAEVCPERRDDFVWENDKFGMRAYGPRDVNKWSGFDRNKFTYWAGAGWSMAGEITDAAAWHETVRRFQETCLSKPWPVASATDGVSKD